MDKDRSEGWDAIAARFMMARSAIGAGLVRAWARDTLAPGAAIVDVGCGSGVPIAQALVEEGFEVWGIDASPTLIAAFRARFPDARSACEAAQDSAYFGRSFDAAVAVGLLFLLNEADQLRVIHRVAHALKPGGRFLFTAPRERLEWDDVLTGRRSLSLGAVRYEALLQASSLRLVGCSIDEGENYYYDAVKPLS